MDPAAKRRLERRARPPPARRGRSRRPRRARRHCRRSGRRRRETPAGQPSSTCSHEHVVQRPAELRAAAVVLAVRADEEERVVDRLAGRRRGRARAGRRSARARGGEARRSVRVERATKAARPSCAPLAPADEEDARVRERGAAPRRSAFNSLREVDAVDGFVGPDAAVLDQDPAVDAARRRPERLRCSRLRSRAEGLRRRQASSATNGRSPGRSLRRPGATVISDDGRRPVRGELVLHLHRLDDADHGAGLDLVAPPPRRTLSTVPCIGLTTESRPAPPRPEASRSRRRRASSIKAGSGSSTLTS